MVRSKNLKVLLLVSNPDIFDHALALFNQMSKSGAQVKFLLPDGAVLPERYIQLEAFVLKGFSKYFVRRYKYIWFQEPYQELWDPFWKDLIHAKHVIYSGYGLIMTDTDEFHYGLDFYKNCSTIMIQNTDMHSKFVSMGINEEKLLFTGDPLKYELKNILNENFSSEKYDLVWMPHWTFKWMDGRKGFARWPEMFEEILSLAKSNPLFKILIRAHPLMDDPNIVESDFKWSDVKNKLMFESNITFSNSSLVDDIISSKSLISDGVTPIAYFGLTGKPVCYFKGVGEFGPFNENGLKIVKTTKVASSSDEILSWIKEMRSTNYLGNKLLQTINEIFPNFTDSPGKLLVSHLNKIESA
jgi:hypothetical protein